MTQTSRQWKFRVVKRARGMQGEYFDFATAKTFNLRADADAYAERFAREQAHVGSVQIDVRDRSGRRVAVFSADRYREQSA